MTTEEEQLKMLIHCGISLHTLNALTTVATMTFAVCQKTQRRDINLLELKALTFPWIEVYTMLAFVEEGSTILLLQ